MGVPPSAAVPEAWSVYSAAEASGAAAAEFARHVAQAEAAGGAATERGVCYRCETSLPLAVGFSKEQQLRVGRGTGKTTCGWHEPAPSGGDEA